MDHPTNYKKRDSSMNAWLNVIYKMMADGFSNEIIYFYIKHQESFHDSDRKLENYIYIIGKKIIFQTEPYSIEKQLWNGYYRQK